MAESHIYIAEGASVTRPPAFNGEDYHYWKDRMRLFIESTHIDLWDIIESGPYTPVDEDGNLIPRARWTADQKARFQLNSKAKFFLSCALSRSEYDKVHGCDTAKEMWDTLSIAHEGTSQVKESKISILVHQYELFKMKDDESIDQMFGRFQTIINGLKALGRTYNNQDHVRKILRSLPKRWRPKVTAVQEAKDLSVLKLDELLGSLKIHEVELDAEDRPRRDKSIALKAGQKNQKIQKKAKKNSSKALKIEELKDDDLSETESESSDEDDELSFISRKIRRMWKKKPRGNSTFRKNNKDDGKNEKSTITCYECNKPGHYKSECPTLKKKPKKSRDNKKSMMATWEDFDSSESDTSSELSEHANICLVAEEESDEEVTSDYNDLQNAYSELLEDSHAILKQYKLLKKKYVENLKHTQEIESENERLSKQIEHIKKNGVTERAEEIQQLKQRINTLSADLATFTESTRKMNDMLGKCRHPSDKSGLGFTGNKSQHKSKPRTYKKSKKNFQARFHQQTHVMHYHSVHYTNPQGPKRVWVPKNKIISPADILPWKRQQTPLVFGQWLLASHDGKKVYVPRSSI